MLSVVSAARDCGAVAESDRRESESVAGVVVDAGAGAMVGAGGADGVFESRP